MLDDIVGWEKSDGVWYSCLHHSGPYTIPLYREKNIKCFPQNTLNDQKNDQPFLDDMGVSKL